ncbi:hypothetical protein QYE76_033415 [Lolium multiflorum]|uniref:Uncharacterized protein n=1 Tax=Lolium multiflorum TaxID=4521 RepID=A0AAD8QW26_LOLMU|nr:hypothetical protein QYE76_033415 [Lolium multiflorum]
MTRCSGGDGGVDGGDDDDDDGDDVPLDDDGDGVDFPLREGISPDSCPPESSFLSGVLRPAEAAVTLREENKNSADIMTWREYEALRNEMQREFRTQDDELKGSIQEISQKLDATNETVTTMTDQTTDIQLSLQALQLAVDNLTQQ